MKKFLPTVALFLVSWNCLEKATGYEKQYLFQQDMLWIWYIIAFGWIVAGIQFISDKD